MNRTCCFSTQQSLIAGLDYWTAVYACTFTYTTYNAHNEKIIEQPKNWAHCVCMPTLSMCLTPLLYLIIFNLLLAVTMSVTDLTVLSSSSDTESPIKVLRSKRHLYGNFQFLYLYMYVYHDCTVFFNLSFYVK